MANSFLFTWFKISDGFRLKNKSKKGLNLLIKQLLSLSFYHQFLAISNTLISCNGEIYFIAHFWWGPSLLATSNLRRYQGSKVSRKLYYE